MSAVAQELIWDDVAIAQLTAQKIDEVAEEYVGRLWAEVEAEEPSEKLLLLGQMARNAGELWPLQTRIWAFEVLGEGEIEDAEYALLRQLSDNAAHLQEEYARKFWN
jgi:uncharacterized membrane-anchored protein YjiN (DUF445 family)